MKVAHCQNDKGRLDPPSDSGDIRGRYFRQMNKRAIFGCGVRLVSLGDSMVERTWAKIINIDCMSKARSNLSLKAVRTLWLSIIEQRDSPQPEKASS